MFRYEKVTLSCSLWIKSKLKVQLQCTFFLQTMNQRTTHKVKGVGHSGDHLTLLFPSALWRVSASFRTLLWFSGPQILSHHHRSQQQQQMATFRSEKALITLLTAPPPTSPCLKLQAGCRPEPEAFLIMVFCGNGKLIWNRIHTRLSQPHCI